MPSPITPQLHREIAREIREAEKGYTYNTEKIAKKFNVSNGTVNRIRSARTWNSFLALKASRQISPKTSKTERELASGLKALESAPNRDEYDHDKRIVRERLDGLLNLNINNRKSLDRHKGALIVLILVAAIALALAVSK